MPLPPDLPVVDHHCHLSPTGEGIAAVRRFAAAGGTHLFVATQNYRPSTPTTVDEYADQFRTTWDLVSTIGRETPVVAFGVVAPHPTDLGRAADSLGLDAAVELHRRALELAGKEVEEQRAVAIGEVGRPHFPVSPELKEAAESVFAASFEVARDVGCPVVVHSEDLAEDGYREIVAIAARCGFPPNRIVKHFARAIVPAEKRLGIVPSYLAQRELADGSLATPGPWFWETDFLDDPARRGAVLDLATIPKRAHRAAERADGLEALRIPFVDAVESVYGFTPRVGRGSL